MLQRFLDPATLASISGLDLVAKTVVDGFVAGLHRSPDFGFSQEFAEYRAYSQGDDLRHVDWNVFARTDKCFLKRYRGETNTQLLILLDTSASMAYGSHSGPEAGLRALRGGVAVLHGQPAARRRRADHLRRRRGQLRAAFHPTGAAFPAAARHRARRAGHAHRFYQTVRAFSEFPAPPRHRGGALGFLRAARNHRQDRGAAALQGQRSRAVPRARSAGDQARNSASRCCWWTWKTPAKRWKFRRNTPSNEYRRKIDAHIEALRSRRARRAWITS